MKAKCCKLIYIVVAIIVAICMCSCNKTEKIEENSSVSIEENISVSFSTEGLYYVGVSDGNSPMKFYYEDHKEILDSVFEMITGNYHYVGKDTIYGRSGGGPRTINLFDKDGNVLYSFRYQNNCHAVFYNDHDYYLYEKDTGDVDLKALEDYCKTMRTAQNTYEALYTHEFHIWSTKLANSFESTNAPKTFEAEFDGEVYSGEYDYSLYQRFDTYRTDYYTMENGWFCVNSSNNKVTSIVFTNVSGTGNITAEECRAEAMRIAEQFIDISKYEMTVDSNEFLHTFKFEKYISDIKSCACFYISFSTSGELVQFSSGMTDEMEVVTNSDNIKATERTISWLTSEGAEFVLANKIRISNPNMDEYKIIDKTVVLLENGEVAVAYTVNITEFDLEEDTGYVMESSQRKDIVVKYITK